MKILIAPDKFKGSLSALEVCQAIKNGIKKTERDIEVLMHPMADGGDGSLLVLTDYLNLSRQEVLTVDPLGREISAPYFTSAKAAFIEVASASGLVLLEQEERDPMKTSTFGTGIMIADAIAKGFRQIYLFLGGSATNDAGMGIASALGCHFLDEQKEIVKPIGGNLSQVKSIETRPHFDFKHINLTLLCDVINPLFGKNGAASVYAAQKGATLEQIEYLDEGLRNFGQVLYQLSGTDVSNLSGSGAAGGIGAGLVALFGAKVEKGFDAIARLTNLESHIEQVDEVISGEGRLDDQSLQGKVIEGVAKLCKKHNKRLTLLVGKNDLPESEAASLKITSILSIAERAINLEDAMSNGAKYLEGMAETLSWESCP